MKQIIFLEDTIFSSFKINGKEPKGIVMVGVVFAKGSSIYISNAKFEYSIESGVIQII